MTRPEKAAYLANVISIARADGDTSPREAAVLGEVVRRIGADNADMAAAKDLIGSGDYRLNLLSAPSHRLGNMEDMVLMALADGRLTPEEANPIERVAEVLNYAQADMDTVMRRAETRLRRLAAPDPPAPAQANSKVSARRSAPQPPVPPLPETPPAATLKTPSSLPRPDHRTPDQSPPPQVSAPAAPPEADTRQAAPSDGSALAACEAARNAAGSPEYCFGSPECLNLWGCRLLRMDWTRTADWFEIGAFRDDRTFVLDREAVAARLHEAMESVSACPFFHRAYAEEALNQLPGRAVEGPRWQYRHARPDQEGRPVRVRDTRHGITVHSDAIASCLEPVGTRTAQLVITRALKRSGRKDVDAGKI